MEEIYQRDIKQVNEILSDAIGKTDDEVAGLLREKYNEEILGPSFNIKRALIYNKNIAAEVLIEKGEKKHLLLEESDMNYKDLLKAFKKFDVKGVVVCESPIMEKDAVILKEFYNSL